MGPTGPVGCPETSVTTDVCCVTSQKSEDLTLKQSRNVTVLNFFCSALVACCLNPVMGFGDRLGYAVAATCFLFSHPEDGGSTFLRNLGTNLLSSTVQEPRKLSLEQHRPPKPVNLY